MEYNKFYSQNDEDYIINDILEKINDTEKYCVEFGAWDGITGSNAYYFIKNHNYKSVLIEGDENKYRHLISNMKNYNAICVCKYVVTPEKQIKPLF